MKALIVAVDEDFGIGKYGTIPWHYSEDMKFFSKITKGSSCIMGRKTYEDLYQIFKDKPGLLPNRECIVVTSTPDNIDPSKAIAVTNVEDAIEAATLENIFFIGGASIYEAAITWIDTAYVTFIPGKHECDVEIHDVVRWIEKHFMADETKQSEDGNLLFVTFTSSVPE